MKTPKNRYIEIGIVLSALKGKSKMQWLQGDLLEGGLSGGVGLVSDLITVLFPIPLCHLFCPKRSGFWLRATTRLKGSLCKARQWLRDTSNSWTGNPTVCCQRLRLAVCFCQPTFSFFMPWFLWKGCFYLSINDPALSHRKIHSKITSAWNPFWKTYLSKRQVWTCL